MEFGCVNDFCDGAVFSFSGNPSAG